MRKIRPYCALCQYPGKIEFLIGSFPVDDGVVDINILERIFKEFFYKIFPDEFPLPKILKFIPGQLFFVPEE